MVIRIWASLINLMFLEWATTILIAKSTQKSISAIPSVSELEEKYLNIYAAYGTGRSAGASQSHLKIASTLCLQYKRYEGSESHRHQIKAT
jgi:hypothetical protein